MTDCLVCAAPTSGDWCSKSCRTALRSLGRALSADLRSSEAIARGTEHMRLTADSGLGFPWELVS